MSNTTHVSDEINHLFRHEYGKLVAVLTKTFGVNQIELAEDVVQEAMIEALEQWSYSGIPDNAAGWIYKVARYKALNILNREKHKHAHAAELKHQGQENNLLPEVFTEAEISDDQLRMMFTCCHPQISGDSQIALTLKTLCGFSIPEIAKAFVTNTENINKRLVRARKNIQNADVAFEVPTGDELQPRLESVLEVLYLLFNEGYHTSHGPSAIRFELCEEAIRLAELVRSNDSIVNKGRVASLLSLMCFNASRFKARLDSDENLVDLAHQDRSLWNKTLISNGVHYLNMAVDFADFSKYQILATISANHCTAPSFESTNWKSILELYDHLIQIDDSPIVKLNRAVVVSLDSNPSEGLSEIEQIQDITSLKGYLPFYTVKAELHIRNQEPQKAIALLKSALDLKPNQKLAKEIENKISILSD